MLYFRFQTVETDIRQTQIGLRSTTTKFIRNFWR